MYEVDVGIESGGAIATNVVSNQLTHMIAVLNSDRDQLPKHFDP